MNGIIGHSGFVGSNINNQTKFDVRFNSKNISDIKGKSFELLVCCGISSIRWYANNSSEKDLESIQSLASSIVTAKINKLVVISTIGVYDTLNGVYEDYEINEKNCDSYGSNRLWFEKFANDNYDSYIIRLPALFGKNMKKNPIYDLIHNNYDYLPHPNSEYQYYPLENLWKDIEIALSNNINLLNICSEPIKFSRILSIFDIQQLKFQKIIKENVKSRYSYFWKSNTDYLYSRDETFKELHSYILRNIKKY